MPLLSMVFSHSAFSAAHLQWSFEIQSPENISLNPTPLALNQGPESKIQHRALVVLLLLLYMSVVYWVSRIAVRPEMFGRLAACDKVLHSRKS